MSLQWTFVATFLYLEIFLVVLLMVPFISPHRWQKIFRSRLLSSFSYYANLYFNIFIVILIILFCDSVRDVKRYSETHEEEGDIRNHPAAEAVLHMKLFRSQRNFYIAGFALFLFLVLRRLVTLISRQATIEADRDTIMKQAEGANAAAKLLLEEKDNKDNENKGDKAEAALAKELEAKKLEFKKVQEELKSATVNLDAMKKQATATNTEYDRLVKEHASLQEQMKSVGGDDSKKDA